MNKKVNLPCLTADKKLYRSCRNLIEKRNGNFKPKSKQRWFFLDLKGKDEIFSFFQEKVKELALQTDKIFIQRALGFDDGGITLYGFLVDDQGIRVELRISRCWRKAKTNIIPYDENKYHRDAEWKKEVNAKLSERNEEMTWGKIKVFALRD